MVFGPIGKTRWPPWPLIDWDIFDFSSVTANWNSTKLERKQDLNVLNQGCVFRADWKNKMATQASDWLGHSRLLPWNRWMEFNKITGSKISTSSTTFVFFGSIGWTRWPPGLWFAETFSTSPPWPLNKIQRNLTGSKISMSSTHFVLFGPIKKAALASDWLRHFRFLLCDHWTEFNETWQEEKFQRPLSLVRVIRRNLTVRTISTSSTKFVFFGPIGKTKWPPGLWLAETFSTSPLNGIQQNFTVNKICQCHLSSLCFLGRSEKHCTQVYDMWLLGLLLWMKIKVWVLVELMILSHAITI